MGLGGLRAFPRYLRGGMGKAFPGLGAGGLGGLVMSNRLGLDDGRGGLLSPFSGWEEVHSGAVGPTCFPAGGEGGAVEPLYEE